jgi:hypothetical protein
MSTEAFGHQHLDWLPHQLGPRVPKNPLGLSIDHDNLAAGSTITIAFGAASTTSRKRRSPADSLLGLVIEIALDGRQSNIRRGRMSIKNRSG